MTFPFTPALATGSWSIKRVLASRPGWPMGAGDDIGHGPGLPRLSAMPGDLIFGPTEDRPACRPAAHSFWTAVGRQRPQLAIASGARDRTHPGDALATGERRKPGDRHELERLVRPAPLALPAASRRRHLHQLCAGRSSPGPPCCGHRPHGCGVAVRRRVSAHHDAADFDSTLKIGRCRSTSRVRLGTASRRVCLEKGAGGQRSYPPCWRADGAEEVMRVVRRTHAKVGP